jgi:hypothetical protein
LAEVQSDLHHFIRSLIMRILKALILATSLALSTSAYAMCCGGEKAEAKSDSKMQCGKGEMNAEAKPGTAEQSQGAHEGMDMSKEKPMPGMKAADGCCCGCCGGMNKS